MASNHAEDLMMHLNQPVPLAYCHLLEFMVTLYIFIMPLALVHKLRWIAIPIAPVVTLFFYDCFRLGFSMLMDPFQKDSGFDTNTLITSNILTMASLEQNVPLARAVEEAHEGDLPSMTTTFQPEAQALQEVMGGTPPRTRRRHTIATPSSSGNMIRSRSLQELVRARD